MSTEIIRTIDNSRLPTSQKGLSFGSPYQSLWLMAFTRRSGACTQQGAWKPMHVYHYPPCLGHLVIGSWRKNRISMVLILLTLLLFVLLILLFISNSLIYVDGFYHWLPSACPIKKLCAKPVEAHLDRATFISSSWMLNACLAKGSLEKRFQSRTWLSRSARVLWRFLRDVFLLIKSNASEFYLFIQ